MIRIISYTYKFKGEIYSHYSNINKSPTCKMSGQCPERYKNYLVKSPHEGFTHARAIDYFSIICLVNIYGQGWKNQHHWCQYFVISVYGCGKRGINGNLQNFLKISISPYKENLTLNVTKYCKYVGDISRKYRHHSWSLHFTISTVNLNL